MYSLRKEKKEERKKRPTGSFFLNIKISNILISLLLISFIIFLWEISLEYFDVPKRIAPKPSDLFDFIQKEFFTTHSSGYQNVLIKTLFSLRDAMIGFVLSLLIGTSLGIVISKSKYIFSALFPFLFLTQLIPVTALAPIIAALMGYGFATKIFIIVLFCIFPVMISVRKTVINLPENYTLLLHSYSPSRVELLRYLVLPSLVPTILSTMKILCSASIVASIITELPLSVRTGIGKDIYNSFNNQIIPRVWVSIIIVSLISLAFYICISNFEKYINNKYKYGQY
jgi:ABC-type nitrate/sulfonate/bicarbonate transport system permease component